MPPCAKWIAIAGQSNALLFMATAPPSSCCVTRVGTASTPIGAGPVGCPWPNGWGAADPNGRRNRLAQDLIAHSASVSTPAILWFHGESDANGHSDTYAADLSALISNIGNRTARSIYWGIVRLNVAFNAEEPVYGPIIRADVATVVAEDTTRRFMIDVDDLVPNAQQHYDTAKYNTIWSRFLSGMETITGDGSWTP